MTLGIGPHSSSFFFFLLFSSPNLSSPQFSSHVYCDRTAAWIKMPLSMDVGLGQGHIVLDGDPAPLPKGGTATPISVPCLLWPYGWMDQDATWYFGRPQPGQHCVRCGPSSTPRAQPPNFRPMSIVVKRSPISATAEHLLNSSWGIWTRI